MGATQDLVSLLGPLGPLARGMPHYEAREGQLSMALRIQAAIERSNVLLCEAGTGTGKTLAYLVPAILSGKKVIVSTASRALQDQLLHKDLPLLRDHLGLSPRIAVMKGLSNYLCLRRYTELVDHTVASQHELPQALADLASWRQQTLSGDFAELEQFEEDSPLLGQVASGSDTRLGSACQHFNECFVTRMKRDAEAAQLVIVNHHLFFADLALRGPHPARVLPNYDVVIFDEAHRLEDTAVTFFGSRLSTTRIAALLGELERTLRAGGLLAAPGSTAATWAPLQDVKRCSASLFEGLARLAPGQGEGSRELEPELWAGPLQAQYFALDEALAGLAAYCESLLDEPRAVQSERAGAAYAQRLELCLNRCRSSSAELTAIVEGARGNVCWFAQGKRSAAIGLSPVELGELLRERLFETAPCVVLTSATLSGAGPTPPAEAEAVAAPAGQHADFCFIRRRLGLDAPHLAVEELFVPSPFDFERNALLYTAADLPPPDSAGWGQRLAARIVQLLEACDGGALVLTTSTRSMQQLERLLDQEHLNRPLLMQGNAPKQVLLDQFREAMNAVLVATSSFWEGVDVPGKALRMVVLDRIPFPVPSDPLVKARSEALERTGGRPFMDLHLPLAHITLKQGFGRLIRQRDDWGVVALLDSRVCKRGYGRRLLRGLPPATVTDSLERTLAFLRGR